MTETNPQGPHRWRRMAALALVLPWLAGTAVAFWWFEQGPGSPPTRAALAGMDEAHAERLAQQLHMTSPAAAVRLVHFWDPACTCARDSDAHLQRILASQGPEAARVTVVVPDSAARARALRRFRHLGDPQVLIAAPDSAPPASPVAAVLSPDGSLAYLGPYRTGAGCRPAPDGPVADTLNDLRRGEAPRSLNLLDAACFCTWPEAGRHT